MSTQNEQPGQMKFTILLGDIVRWIIAIVVLYFAIGVMFNLLNIPFEWLLSFTTQWNKWLHVIIWLGVLMPILMTIVFQVSFLLSLLVSYLIRQKLTFVKMLYLALGILIISAYWIVWSNSLRFSWEAFGYKVFNKFVFSFIILSLILVPNALHGKFSKESSKSDYL